MVEVTQLAGAGLALAAAVIYAAVGTLLRRRDVPGESGRASRLFALWWLALAGSTVLTTTASLAGALGERDLGFHLVLQHLSLLLICIALWALLYYLLFLFTGRSGLFWPLTAVYATYFIFLVYLLSRAGPVGVEAGRWSTTVRYAEPLGGLLLNVLLALLLFPQIVGAIAYGSLYFKLSDPTRKFRVALVSTSIVVWFLTSYVANASGLARADWWVLASRLLGLAAAATVLLAYQPPRFLRERFGLTTILEEARSERGPAPPERSQPSGSPTEASGALSG